MRATRVRRRMSRASRAIFVLVVAVFAALLGAAVANADLNWEFGQPSEPVKRPGIVVSEEPVGPDGSSVLGDAGQE